MFLPPWRAINIRTTEDFICQDYLSGIQEGKEPTIVLSMVPFLNILLLAELPFMFTNTLEYRTKVILILIPEWHCQSLVEKRKFKIFYSWRIEIAVMHLTSLRCVASTTCKMLSLTYHSLVFSLITIPSSWSSILTI